MPPKQPLISDSGSDDDDSSSKLGTQAVFSQAELEMLRTLSPHCRVVIPVIEEEEIPEPKVIPERREQVMKDLADKSGGIDTLTGSPVLPPPSAPITVFASDLNAENISHRAACKIRLHHFFKQYEPSQIPCLDQWLDNWEGREEEMMTALIEYHGPEPFSRITVIPTGAEKGKFRPMSGVDANTITTARALLSGFLGFYDPSKLGDVGAIMRAWRGQEHTLLRRLQRQHVLREHIMRWYRLSYPDDDNAGVVMARQYLGREPELLATLPTAVPKEQRASQRKVGSSAKLPQRRASPSPVKAPGSTSAPQRDLATDAIKAKVYELYFERRPSELAQVPQLLEAYKGSEEALLKRLQLELKSVVSPREIINAQPKVVGRSRSSDRSPKRSKGKGTKAKSHTESKDPVVGSPLPVELHHEEPHVDLRNEDVVESTIHYEGTKIDPVFNLPIQKESMMVEEEDTAVTVPPEGDTFCDTPTTLPSQSAMPKSAAFNLFVPARMQTTAHSRQPLVHPLPTSPQPAMPQRYDANAKNRQLRDALTRAELGVLYSVCVQQDIDLEVLHTLSVDDLRSVGVTSESVLRRFVQFKEKH